MVLAAIPFIGTGWAILILLVWSNFYLYRLHRRVYNHGRISSALRVIVLNFVYSLLLAMGTLIALFLAFLNSG